MTEEEKKESKKASVKKYMEKNKEKIKAYRDKPGNKENKKAYNKAYNQTPEQKAKIKEYNQTPEQKAKIKEYNQTPEGIKYHKISQWKNTEKIISDDWNATYDWVMNTKNCQKCDVLLESGNGKNGKCLDHDHSITDGPNTRAVLCMSCNIHEGHKRHASKEERDKYDNEKIKCDCGTFISRKNMNRHKKSAKHINFHKNL